MAKRVLVKTLLLLAVSIQVEVHSSPVFDHAQQINAGDEILLRTGPLPAGAYVIELQQNGIDLVLRSSSTSTEPTEVQSLTERIGSEFIAFELADSRPIQIEILAVNQQGSFSGSFSLSVTAATEEHYRIFEHLTKAGAAGTSSNQSVRESAIESLEKALALARRVRPDLVPRLNLEIGLNAYWVFDIPRAISHLEQAVQGYEAQERRLLADVSQSHLAAALIEREAYKEAEALFLESLERQSEGGARFEVAVTANNIGLMYRYQRRDDDAKHWYEIALEAFQELGVDYRAAHTLGNLAELAQAQGRHEESRALYADALALLPEDNNVWEKASLLTNLARLERQLGKPSTALTLLSQASREFDRIDEDQEQSWVLTNIAEIYRALGNYRRVVDTQGRIVAYRRQAEQGQVLFNALLTYADDLRSTDQFDELLAVLEELDSLATTPARRASLGLAQARTARAMGDFSKARSALLTSVDLAEQLPDKILLQKIGTELALAHPSNDEQLALALAASEALYRNADPTLKARAAHARALIADRQSDAVLWSERALEALGTARKAVANPWMSTHLSRLEYPVIEHWLRVRWSAAGPEALQSEAIMLTQRARAAALMQLLAEADLIGDRAGKAAASGVTSESWQDFNQFALDLAREELRRLDSRFESITYPEPVSLSEVQTALQFDDTGLDGVLYYFTGESSGVAWYITSAAVTSWSLPGRQTLENLRRDIRRGVSAAGGAGGRELLVALKMAGEYLLPPPRILSGQRLMIVPDAGLAGIPFAALLRRSSGSPQYLIEEFTLEYAPSLHAAFSRAAAVPESVEITFVSGEEAALPGISDEWKSIQSEDGDQQTASIPLNALTAWFSGSSSAGTYRVLHIAAHAQASSHGSVTDGIGLGDGQMPLIPLAQMYDLAPRPVELVMLSACESAIGEEVSGEGVQGIARAFMYLGANEVIATQWRIGDRSAAAFTKRFYSLLSEQQDASQALAEAQRISLKESGPTRHPGNWAAYTHYRSPRIQRSTDENDPSIREGEMQ